MAYRHRPCALFGPEHGLRRSVAEDERLCHEGVEFSEPGPCQTLSALLSIAVVPIFVLDLPRCTRRDCLQPIRGCVSHARRLAPLRLVDAPLHTRRTPRTCRRKLLPHLRLHACKPDRSLPRVRAQRRAHQHQNTPPAHALAWPVPRPRRCSSPPAYSSPGRTGSPWPRASSAPARPRPSKILPAAPASCKRSRLHLAASPANPQRAIPRRSQNPKLPATPTATFTARLRALEFWRLYGSTRHRRVGPGASWCNSISKRNFVAMRTDRRQGCM